MDTRQECVECPLPATHALTEAPPWLAISAAPQLALWCRWHAATHAAYRTVGIDAMPRTYLAVAATSSHNFHRGAERCKQ